MSAPTAVEHSSSPPDNQATRSAVALSIAFIVLAFIGICHFNHRKALLRPLRGRRTVQACRLRPARALGQSAVDRIPMIKYHDYSSSPTTHRHPRSHRIWPGQARPQPVTNRPARPQILQTRLWRMILLRGQRDRDEESQTMPPSTCSICTEDFRQGDQLRNLPCGHLFHPACIDPWLCERSRTCPLWYVFPLSEEYVNKLSTETDLYMCHTREVG